MRQGVPGEQVADQFPVFEDDGYTKHSGLAGGTFTPSVWVDGFEHVAAVTVDEIDSSGEYRIAYTPDIIGYWKVEIFNVYNSEYWISEVDVGDATLSTLYADMQRVLGLLHRNALLDNQIYDGEGRLTGARLRVFADKSNVPATPGGSETTGLLHRYTIEAAYDATGAVKYRFLEEL